MFELAQNMWANLHLSCSTVNWACAVHKSQDKSKPQCHTVATTVTYANIPQMLSLKGPHY